jgi:uncharacterized membrane protein (Fun14 family)
MSNAPKKPAASGGLSKLQKLLLGALAVLFVGSATARAVLLARRDPPTKSSSSTLEPASYLASTKSNGAATETGGGALEDALPYVTEGSLFALIGFALGYTTRKIFKIGLIVLAVFFVALQALNYTKVATVDWGGLVDWLNRAVLNLKENETVTQFLTKRIPTTGALLVGVFLGFKRG